MTALDKLAAGLKSADAVVAGDAARLIGEAGRTEAIPALLRYVKESRYHYKSAGMITLGILGQKAGAKERAEIIATLRELVAAPNVHDDWYWYSYKGVRAAAAVGLLMLADEGGGAYLRGLADKNEDVFYCWFGPAILRLKETCGAVAELKGRFSVAALLNAEQRKTRNTEPGLVTMKTEVLGILGGAEGMAALLDLAKFRSRYVRGQAALSLLEASKDQSRVVEGMADGDATDFVRVKAALGLALLGRDKRGAFVAKAAGSFKDPFDRAVAVESLGLLGAKKHAGTVKRQLTHKDAYVRQCALEALERLDADLAQTAAKKMWKDKSPRVRLQAAKTLAGAGK